MTEIGIWREKRHGSTLAVDWYAGSEGEDDDGIELLRVRYVHMQDRVMLKC